ncbi:RagB/SusD family nutrient uptake outer membrane protein [Dysgonomonas sp. 520]|uniref:RagB/SusD family nutrient uptake outer membrane protein n=1 Tax=Dysgonomonas sp. 520 TaxID=2302931 RepID=UPI0013D635DD|nr:RagB/SusD family nutrient uptake outer membrane protein [Dysgonomonas sp. 520]NDW08727.1 RagB/SusD family nutrient uptake outer membrane protein [Dysgonomonas sp. 520]
MKKYSLIFSVIFALMFTSCDSWLESPSPGVTELDDFFTVGQTAINTTNGAYVPLAWEYNYTYFPEWFIGDVVSDDALKGGQNINDMSVVYDMENFKTIPNNDFLLDFYRAQYQGIGRCNLGLQEIPVMTPDTTMTERVQNRLIGELKFLRAMYYFRLVRVFGGVPLVDFVIDSSTKWKQPRASADDVYVQIIKDLEEANDVLWVKTDYAKADTGRVTKGAAQAMLLKTNLYLKNYPEAKRWGDSIIQSGQYRLLPNYSDNFTLNGENMDESVFEIQYTEDPTSDYGGGGGIGGAGFTRGTFTVILTRSRSSLLGGGWGFNKPTQDLYNEFEPEDPRLGATILDPKAYIENEDQEIYLGTRYLNRKYGMYNDLPGGKVSYFELAHATRAPINNKVIRYSDVLLMYAEACCEANNLGDAVAALNQVRQRARGERTDILPDHPTNTNQSDLRNAIRHERRVELAMEGHRWFDLCRWGIAYEVMTAYKEKESDDARDHMADFIKGKHELFPIPSKEIELNPMEQNNGYN